MDNIIIHVGFHKSASTFLQETVFTHLPVNYVFFAGKQREMLDMVESLECFDPIALHKWVNNEVNQEYGNEKRRVTVLSHEELSGHPHGHESIDPLLVAKNLKKTFPKARILIVIRNQFSYLSSIYTFRVSSKGVESRNFDSFLDEEGKLGLFDHLEYDKLIKHYMDLFGKENIHILPMEGLKKSPESFISSLCDFLQVPYQSFETSQYINKSSKNLAVLTIWRFINYFFGIFLKLLMFFTGTKEKLYYFRRLRYGFYGIKQWSSPVLEKFLKNRGNIDIKRYPEYNQLFKRYAKTNASLNKLTGLDLKEYGYPVHND
ncbi:MAG: sulfotransferase [Deltaproteobacteria bacterium]|nr:sulfotransferase [Deltaproteobacteria bacterium]